jgi:O-antigen/teichoic acid export membrane protein
MSSTPPRVRPSRSFRASAAFTYGASIGVAALSLVNVLIVSRALGPEGRGTVTFLTTVAMITSQLASLGVEEASANLAGQRPAHRASVATNALLLACVLGLASAAIVAGLIAWKPAIGAGSDALLLGVTLAAIPVLIFQFYLNFLIRADYGFAITNSASLVAPVLNVVVNGVLFAAGLITVGTALFTWLAGQLVITVLLTGYLVRRLAGFGKPDPKLAREMVTFGIKAHAGRVMKTGNYRLDQWILGSIGGTLELGLYSVAVAWTEALFFLPEALATVLRPDLVRSSSRDAGARASVVFRAAILLTLPMVVVLVIAAPILCTTFFGDEFHGAIDDLRILAPGAFGIVAMKLLANALVAQGRPMLSNIAIAVAFAVTIGLDVLLIPGLGGTGAAIASTVAYTAGGLAVLFIFIRVFDSRLGDFLPRTADVRMLLSVVRRRG